MSFDFDVEPDVVPDEDAAGDVPVGPRSTWC